MCNICDGMSPDDQLRSLWQKFDDFGWTSMFVEADERSLSWGYTMGMIRAGHAELVIVDEPDEVVARMFGALAPQVLAGRTLEPETSFELFGRRWAVLAVDPSHVYRGMLGWWRAVVPHCSGHATPPAVQLIGIDVLRPADEHGGARLDRRYGASEGRLGTRAQRRREQREEDKRRRQG